MDDATVAPCFSEDEESSVALYAKRQAMLLRMLTTKDADISALSEENVQLKRAEQWAAAPSRPLGDAWRDVELRNLDPCRLELAQRNVELRFAAVEVAMKGLQLELERGGCAGGPEAHQKVDEFAVKSRKSLNVLAEKVAAGRGLSRRAAVPQDASQRPVAARGTRWVSREQAAPGG